MKTKATSLTYNKDKFIYKLVLQNENLKCDVNAADFVLLAVCAIQESKETSISRTAAFVIFLQSALQPCGQTFMD